jgi:hypothetical protein
MPALKNQRHERFALALFEGKPASTAYEEAGYRFNEGNCIRLKGNERVQARLAELQNEIAKKTEITVESICAELDPANAVAKERGQASAMVSASALRAKLAGLMVERVEVGSAGDFSACNTASDFADELLTLLIDVFRPVDAKDRQGLIKLLERQGNETQDYLAAIRARPITAVRHNPSKTPWQQLELHPSAKINNPAEARYRAMKERRRAQLNGR